MDALFEILRANKNKVIETHSIDLVDAICTKHLFECRLL